jgi:hypothetical protein
VEASAGPVAAGVTPGAITAGVLRLVRSDNPRAEIEHVRNVAIQIMLGMMTTAP